MSSSDDEQINEVNEENEEKEEKIGKDKTLQLILAVRKRQALWDNRLTKVDRNAAILLKLWTEVDEELGIFFIPLLFI